MDRTFKQAAESYLEHGGENRYLDKVVEYFGDTPLNAIFPFDIKKMATELYPDHLNATRNRQAITPARAVIIHAYERGWCNMMRFTRLKEDKPKRKTPASPAWLHVFCRQADKDGLPHLSAIVLFMSHTGARVAEATALRWGEVDIPGRRVMLLKTKTERNSVRHLTDEMVFRMQSLSKGEPDPEDRVFRYTSRFSVNERIMAVCERAGIPYKSSHACGRHSFATNAMSMGMDVKTAMEAGGWKSSVVFLETYVHSRNAGRSVADRFNSVQFSGDL